MTWHAAAACRGMDVGLFFPADKTPPPSEVVAACRRCPVVAECLAECLAWSDDNDQGWRAGLTAAERREMRRARRKGAA